MSFVAKGITESPYCSFTTSQSNVMKYYLFFIFICFPSIVLSGEKFSIHYLYSEISLTGFTNYEGTPSEPAELHIVSNKIALFVADITMKGNFFSTVVINKKKGQMQFSCTDKTGALAIYGKGQKMHFLGLPDKTKKEISDKLEKNGYSGSCE